MRMQAETILNVEGIWKRFGGTDVVRDVSLQVQAGHVLGVVGPNGAGKTTSIRIALGIVSPDRGAVDVLGQPLTQSARGRIGYLPEERGLYERRTAVNTVAYLAELKGLAPTTARKKARELLTELGLGDHLDKTPGELSHGMAQLVQLAATIVHEPDLVVLDEPFTAFDPVNVRKLKELVLRLRDAGTAIVLCTHQMHQVEALCDDVVMINDGAVALSGPVDDVRRQHRGNILRIVGTAPPADLAGIESVTTTDDVHSLVMAPGTAPEDVLRQVLKINGATIEQFEVATPSLEEIFVQEVSP